MGVSNRRATLPGTHSSSQEPSSEDPWVELFQNAMDHDLNTSGALAVLFELAKGLQRDGNRLVHEGKT